MVSIFENIYSTGKEVNISYVFDKIRKGGPFVQQIERIQELNKTDENSAQELKKQLPGVTFCGIFKQRKADKLIKATGLVILDFDEKETDYSYLKEDAFIYACWKSPRGGCKALIKIPEVKNDQEFKAYFYAIQSAYPEVDLSGKDISRFCFISYDPEIHINEHSEIWTKKVQNKSTDTSIPLVHNIKSDVKKISIALQMIDNGEIGNRNNTILKAGKLMGGYIATGEVNELDVLDICERAIYAKDPEDYKANIKTFTNGIEYGKLQPLSSSEIKETITEVKIGKIDYSIEDSSDAIDDLYNNGFAKGLETGWKHFNPYYSVKLGYTTYIYGPPFTGKTIWLFNLLVNLSRLSGLKHAIYSPETGSASEVYALLIQVYAQGDITNTFKNQISKTKLEEAKTFIGKHFLVISTDETDDELTPEDILDYVDFLANKYETKIDTVTIDPWNELKHEISEREDIYLNKELKRIRVHARKRNRHLFLITHIRDQKPSGNDELGTTIYPFPTPHDVAGGQVWYRKGFMMLGFYRHFIPDGHDMVKIGKDRTFEKDQLLVRVQKFKPEGTGKRGEIEFRYDLKRHIFTGPDRHIEHIQPTPTINFYEKETDEVPF
jgi:hypothetical protein